MSQTPEQYHVFLKVHEAFIKMCEVSIKTLEIIEQDNKTNSVALPEEPGNMAKLVIETLNLFQDKVFVEQIEGDKIMTKKVEKDKIEISIGDDAHISGEFVVAKSIEKSFNRINSSDMSDELKQLLRELTVAVENMIEHLAEDYKEDVKEDLENLINQSTREKPKQKWWSVSIDGLNKAAGKLGEVGAPVLELIGKILPILLSKSS